MFTGKQFFTEENADAKFALRANDSDPAGAPFHIQAEAIHRFAFPTQASNPDRATRQGSLKNPQGLDK